MSNPASRSPSIAPPHSPYMQVGSIYFELFLIKQFLRFSIWRSNAFLTY
jgi:hypothetical protein